MSVFLVGGLGSDWLTQAFIEFGRDVGSHRGLVQELDNGFEGPEEVILGVFKLGAEGGEVLDGLLGEAVSDVGTSSDIYELA